VEAGRGWFGWIPDFGFAVAGYGGTKLEKKEKLMNEQTLANGLGWFSIGLGLAELLAPEKVGQAIGVKNHHSLLRTLGARELASGVAILAQEKPREALWSRVAGDAIDLGLLGSALRSEGADQQRVIGAIAAVAGVTALDVYCSLQLSSDRKQLAQNGQSTAQPKRNQIRKTITINRSAEEIYAFWRDLENLPRFMNHLKAVSIIDDKRSHWVAKGPAGTEVEWDAEIIEEKPGELIAWRSLPGATVPNAGVVRFEKATGGRGTVVKVNLRYHPPGGAAGATVAKLFGEAPEKQIPVDLLRVKQLLETGEISRTEGQPAGRAESTSAKFDNWLRK